MNDEKANLAINKHTKYTSLKNYNEVGHWVNKHKPDNI